MNINRFLSEDRVDLELDATFDEEHPVDVESLAEHMAGLLERSDAVVNPTKLKNDLVHRERRAASLLGGGLALPHVRTLQARRPILAVGVSRAGLDLGAEDGMPIQLVIALVGPPYDDRVYLHLYKALSERLMQEGLLDAILACEAPGEVVRVLSAD